MKTQGSNGDLIQKFFRVYIPNFTEDNMNLPIVSDNTSGMYLPQKVTVKSVSSGNIWRMEMTTNGESDAVFLRDGWKKIVKDENIIEPVFLVFEFDGSRLFHFCVYEHSSMCKRTRSLIEKEVIDVESEEERGGTSRQRWKTDSHKLDAYLDDELNPSFPVDTTQQSRTRIPSLLIKDYNLTFPNLVTVRDKIGKLKRKILVWKNGSVYLSGLRSFIRRNHVKEGDKMFCELKMVDGYLGLVHEIKIHFIEG